MSRLRVMEVAFTSTLALGILCGSSDAQALSYQYKVNCIRNDTKYNVVVQNQWGNEPWKKHTLVPGGTHTFWYKNRVNPSPPDLKISFDQDPGTGVSREQVTLWTFYANATTCHKGPTVMLFVSKSGQISTRHPRNKY